MRILGVGIATIDIINSVAAYPPPDSEVRALAQQICRGGNATNSLVVLSRLGHDCSWAGTLADDSESERIVRDLARHGVDMRWVVRHHDACTPTSYVTLSREDGSRTIVHHRRLPEFSAADFSAIDLTAFDWIHFEGRNVPELERMLGLLPAEMPCSLEVEKPRAGIERLLPQIRRIMFSRGYAESRGFSDGAAFLQSMRQQLPTGSVVTCAWGAEGAWGMDRDGVLHYSPAFPPPRIVDTLGAGDVFNAALIDGMATDVALPQLLERACRLAGEKCGRQGLPGEE